MKSEARLKAVLENIPVAMLGLSRKERTITWIENSEKIFGFTAMELIGKPLSSVLLPAHSARELNKLRAKSGGKRGPKSCPGQGISKTGQPLELNLFWEYAGQEWVAVIHDLTESKRLQRQLIKIEKLTAAEKLISCIAHELNNPLQAISGYAQLILKNIPPISLKTKSELRKRQELMKEIRLIHENSLRCQKIIDNLVLFVRRDEILKRPVHLKKTITSALDLLGYKLKKAAELTINLKVSAGLPMVQADFQQIQQVFVNLINNAYDAMTVRDGPKILKIEAGRKKTMVRVKVTDSGHGVPLNKQGQLFKPFFTTKPEGKGTGLGLSICREIIEEHGGQIGFEGGDGWTTFWLDLPVTKSKNGNRARPEFISVYETMLN